MLHLKWPCGASDSKLHTCRPAASACRGPAQPSQHQSSQHLASPAVQAGEWPVFDSRVMGNLASCFGAGAPLPIVPELPLAIMMQGLPNITRWRRAHSTEAPLIT